MSNRTAIYFIIKNKILFISISVVNFDVVDVTLVMRHLYQFMGLFLWSTLLLLTLLLFIILTTGCDELYGYEASVSIPPFSFTYLNDESIRPPQQP